MQTQWQIISFFIFTCAIKRLIWLYATYTKPIWGLQMVWRHRYHSSVPLPKGRGRTFKKLRHLRWVEYFLLERGINLKRGGRGEGVATFLLLYISIIFTVFGEGGSKVSFITFWIFSLSSYPCKILIQVFIVLKPDIICTFLIHSGSLQKMLTALFNLVSNAQKSKWIIYFECQGKIFLSIEKVLEKVSEDQPIMYCITVKGVTYLFRYNLRNIIKQNLN